MYKTGVSMDLVISVSRSDGVGRGLGCRFWRLTSTATLGFHVCGTTSLLCSILHNPSLNKSILYGV